MLEKWNESIVHQRNRIRYALEKCNGKIVYDGIQFWDGVRELIRKSALIEGLCSRIVSLDQWFD